VDQVANEWMAYYTAGVSLQWSLWSWGSDIHNIEAREIDARSSELRLAQLRRKTEADISSILNDIDVLKKNMALLDQQIIREKEKFGLIRVRVQEGLANTLELVDAETALTEASLARQKASILYALKVHELAVSIGREF
jgi:outer membrane protein TolC